MQKVKPMRTSRKIETRRFFRLVQGITRNQIKLVLLCASLRTFLLSLAQKLLQMWQFQIISCCFAIWIYCAKERTEGQRVGECRVIGMKADIKTMLQTGFSFYYFFFAQTEIPYVLHISFWVLFSTCRYFSFLFTEFDFCFMKRAFVQTFYLLKLDVCEYVTRLSQKRDIFLYTIKSIC